jgi:hypothetical protein
MAAASGTAAGFGRFVLLIGTALLLAAAMSVYVWAGPMLLLAGCILALSAFSRLDITNLAITYVLGDHIFQFTKRCIFLFGTPSRTSYYSFQLIPALMLALGLAGSIFVLKRYRLTLSTKYLIAFLLVSIGNTLIFSRGASATAKLGGVAQHTFPIMAIFLGMAIPLSAWKRLGALLLFLIIVSSTYGVYQYIHGPTFLDIAWASQAAGYSIEASKVYDYLYGAGGEFRAYSYLGDHLTWGFFLVVAFVGVIFARCLRLIPKRWVYIAIPFTVAGILVAQTRTVWASFLATLIIYRLMTMRFFRRPLLVITALFIAFAGVVYGGQWASTHLISRISSNALVTRYLTVGTIEARTSAIELFVRLLPSHWIFGQGLGASADYSGLSSGATNIDFEAQFSHNMFVDFLLYMGLPGVILIILFFYAWLKEAFWLASISDPARAAGYRWLIALFVGMWLTGALNGSTFMGGFFFLTIGVVTGEAMRLQREYAEYVFALSAKPVFVRRALAVAET